MDVAGQVARHRPTCRQLLYLLPLLLIGACGPKKPTIPEEIEPIARRCYATLVTPERTPKLRPAAAMEDGTFLILWSMVEFPNERGSCTVDGSGVVLLLTSNADETLGDDQPPPADASTP